MKKHSEKSETLRTKPLNDPAFDLEHGFKNDPAIDLEHIN